MLVENILLNDVCLVVEKKSLDLWFYSGDFCISKKVIKSLVGQIFDYLSSDEVYINIFDRDFEKLIMLDLNDSILNFISGCDDYVFMCNFKGSIRHDHNEERDRLMEFLEIFDFEKLRPYLELTRKNSEKGGRPGYDVVLMFQILFIKAYYDLSDEKTARRIRSDDVCQCFLGISRKISV
jgi:hypothetical protein